MLAIWNINFLLFKSPFYSYFYNLEVHILNMNFLLFRSPC